MVDEGRVARLLRDVTARVERLRSARDLDQDDRGDLWLDGIKYLFVTAIEGCLDIAHHIAASEGLASPATNAESMRALGAHGVIGADLAVAMASAAGFRNVLVHGYVDVDDSVVVDALDELGDLDDFVSSVSAWMLSDGSVDRR